MSNSVPALGILLDLPLGIFMWAAVLRFFLAIFMSEDSSMRLMRMLNAMLMPLIATLSHLTPRWVIARVAPLYLAFWLFVIRFYLLPLIMGYDIRALTYLPFENLLVSATYDILSLPWNWVMGLIF